MLGRLSLVHFLAGAIFLIAGPAAYALELVRAQRQPEPLHPLKVDWVDLVEVGLDVAGATIPVAKAGATAIKFEKGAFEVLDLSVGGRTAELEDDLLLIDSDARRLQDLKAQGRDLRTDPEARDVIDRLQRRMTAPGDNPYAFAARALFSRHGVYGTATVVGRNWAAGRFAKKMTRTLGVGPFTSEAIAGSKWGRLKRVSRLSRNLSDALTKAFFKKITKAIFDTVLAEKLKEIERRIAAETHSHAGRRVSGYSLRLQVLSAPQLVLPTLVEPVAASPAPVLVLPERIQTYVDPVVNGISVERQIIERQHYEVRGSRETVREPAVSHPIRDETPSPRNESMGNRSPDFDPDRFFRGGFDSPSGNMWGRF